MAPSTRTLQSTDDRSILLALYKELEENKGSKNENLIQQKIDQIIAQNYLKYVNR
jgi:hypothetical protein